MVCTSTSANGGSSGAPQLDKDGNVWGVNIAAYSDGRFPKPNREQWKLRHEESVFNLDINLKEEVKQKYVGRNFNVAIAFEHPYVMIQLFDVYQCRSKNVAALGSPNSESHR